ncbi:MAG: PEP-CTERM sorting domain-containing protein [Verrucomicrobia bacterium]|nr:PEP-CTERM sorting domain-containing protein [Verrucomicrobiota bacterium]
MGIGEVGSLSLQGGADWRELVQTRGQAGAPVRDFGPWGGSIGFDSSPSTIWHFDLDPLRLDDLPPDVDDFFTVAQHELGHLFGIGFSASWRLQIEGDLFAGPNSILTFGGSVPLDSGEGHWEGGTMSHVLGTDLAQELLMAPDLSSGTRKYLTDLDIAGLRDVGWTVVPEPGTAALLLLGLGVCWMKRRNGCRIWGRILRFVR